MTSSERVILVGGGGFCREVFSWALDCHEAGRIPPVGGFLDDRGEALDGYSLPWLGTIRDYLPQPNDRCVLALGNPRDKARVAESLLTRGARFIQLIHPTAVVSRTAKLGEGVVMCPMTMANPESVADRFVTIISFSGLGHDSKAGEFTTISSHVDVMGHAQLGARVLVGSGARIMPSVKVDDDALIGTGSVVVRRVSAGSTVYAPPAKVLRKG